MTYLAFVLQKVLSWGREIWPWNGWIFLESQAEAQPMYSCFKCQCYLLRPSVCENMESWHEFILCWKHGFLYQKKATVWDRDNVSGQSSAGITVWRQVDRCKYQLPRRRYCENLGFIACLVEREWHLTCLCSLRVPRQWNSVVLRLLFWLSF